MWERYLGTLIEEMIVVKRHLFFSRETSNQSDFNYQQVMGVGPERTEAERKFG